VHHVTEFLSFTVALVAAMLGALYGSLVGLLPASVWVAGTALVFVLILHSRLASRIEDIEMALVEIEAKLDTILSRLPRPRDHETTDRQRN
jgi:Flp pilus assembly protein TadB